MGPNEDITLLVRAWQAGDRTAEQELFEALYGTLHRIALNCLKTEPISGSLGPTGLIHEAYLRFANAENLSIANRGHFLALVSRVMRRIIVDRARARKNIKRGGKYKLEPLDDELVATVQDADQILAVDLALDELNEHWPRQAKIVELRYFGGFSMEEIAAILGIAARTARRDWEIARLRLKLAIDGAPEV